MKDQMSGFDIRRMVSEVNAFTGGWMKKAYQPHHEQVVLRLNPRDGRQQDLVIVRGKRLYLSRRDRPMPQQPSPFAMLLRKHLGNARLEKVEQHGFDRIVVMTFDSREGIRHLVIECFRDGNIIITDESHVIIQPLTHATYAGRKLKRGETYRFPPEAMDPHHMDTEAMRTLLESSDRELVRTLAGQANLGGSYARAVCSLAEVDEKMPATEAASVSESISQTLHSMLQELSGNTSAWLVIADDAPEEITDTMHEHAIEATPLILPEHEGRRLIEMESLAQAVDSWLGPHDSQALARRQEEEEAATARGGKVSNPVETLERRLSQQEKALEKFDRDLIRMQAMGHAIQEAWTHVDTILHQTRAAVQDIGWKGVRDRIADLEWIKSCSPADRTIVAILPDEGGSSDGPEVSLNIDETVHQNAQRWFEKGRKQKEKSAGARKALEETRKALEKARRNQEKAEVSGRLSGRRRSRRLWFENHRWTILDGMHLMVGGREAKGNDMLVKKHLRSDDRYVHADLHGASSAVMKLKSGFIKDQHPPLNLPEGIPALRLVDDIGVQNFSEDAENQAASVAFSWSRAWNAGRGGGTVFWVKPGQVSKTAETGEFVGKGAFIIRGQRNWHRDVEFHQAVGLVCINSVPLLLCGHRDSISSICQRWASLAPDVQKKESVANSIAKATGLSVDDILPVLPGNCRVVDDNGLLKWG